MAQLITTPSKILLRVPNWVGDAVMSLPALEQLRQKFPAAELVVLARPTVADLYRHLPAVSRVLVFDHRGLRCLRRLAGELRRQRFDLAVLFQNAFRAALVAWWAGIPQRLGYVRDARRLLLTIPIAVPRKGEIPAHETYYYLELLRRAGLLDTLPEVAHIPLAPDPALVEHMRLRLRESGVSDAHPRVVLAPGASYGSAKCWLLERYAALADRLVEAHSAAVLLCGTSSEARLGEEIVKHMRCKPVSFIGQTTLAEFLALLSSADLFIGNDSGAMHLAAGVGLPQVIIFGPTDENGTGPLNPGARIVKHPVPCSPCFLRRCPIDHRCMRRISVDEVWRTVEEVLAAERRPQTPQAGEHP